VISCCPRERERERDTWEEILNNGSVELAPRCCWENTKEIKKKKEELYIIIKS
jgi:hypothetical protein